MKVLMFLLALAISGVANADIHSPDASMRLYGERASAGYCVYLESDGQIELLSERGALTEKQLRKTVSYAGYARHLFIWFVRANAIKNGELDATVAQMNSDVGLEALWAEKYLRRVRVDALVRASGQDIELSDRKIQVIAGKIAAQKVESGNHGACAQ